MTCLLLCCRSLCRDRPPLHQLLLERFVFLLEGHPCLPVLLDCFLHSNFCLLRLFICTQFVQPKPYQLELLSESKQQCGVSTVSGVPTYLRADIALGAWKSGPEQAFPSVCLLTLLPCGLMQIAHEMVHGCSCCWVDLTGACWMLASRRWTSMEIQTPLF